MARCQLQVEAYCTSGLEVLGLGAASVAVEVLDHLAEAGQGHLEASLETRCLMRYLQALEAKVQMAEAWEDIQGHPVDRVVVYHRGTGASYLAGEGDSMNQRLRPIQAEVIALRAVQAEVLMVLGLLNQVASKRRVTTKDFQSAAPSQ